MILSTDITGDLLHYSMQLGKRLVLSLLLLHYLGERVTGAERSLVVPTQAGAGLMNQLTVICKALIIGNLLKRTTVISRFNIHFSGTQYLPLGEIIDVEKTNTALNRLLPSTVLSTAHVEPQLCLHMALKLDQKCGGAAEPVVLSGGIASAVMNEQRSKTIERLGMSAWSVYVWPRADLEVVTVLKSLFFRQIFYEARDKILSAYLNISRAHRSTRELNGLCHLENWIQYAVVHLRFEDDFLVYQHRLQSPRPNSSISDYSNMSLTKFITRVKKFVVPQSIDTIYICAGHGDAVDRGVSLLKHEFPRVTRGPKTEMFRIRQSASSGNSIMHIINDALTRGVSLSVSNARELYALVDFLVALEASVYVGVSGSSFSKCVAQLRRYCGFNGTILWNPKVKPVHFTPE